MRWSRRFLHSLSLTALAGTLLLPRPALAESWSVSRGNPAATGSINIDTSAAMLAQSYRYDIGTFADGVGPVVGSDGRVVLANEQGKIMVTEAGGNPVWERQLNAGYTIKSTPAIASNGHVYVLSSHTYTDHRVTPAVKRWDVEINGFDTGGGWLFRFAVPAPSGGAIATAPLNIMRAPDGSELIVFPIRYRPPSPSTSTIVHLYAYTLTGSLAAHVPVTSVTTPIEGGTAGGPSGPAAPAPLEYDGQPHPVNLPVPGVAVMPTDPTAVVLNDGIKSIVSYRFDGTTFQQLWRQDRKDLLSAPAIAYTGRSVLTGASRYRIFNTLGEDTESRSIVGSYAPPTLVPTGAVVFINRNRRMIRAGGGIYDIGGDSIAPAVASRNFIYISSARGLASYRASDFQFVSIYDWPNGDHGGRSEPVIGPAGFIYALAGNKLYTFFPSTEPANRTNAGSGGVVGGEVGGNDTGGKGDPKPMKNALNPAILTAPQATTDGAGAGNAITGGKVYQAQPNAILNGMQQPTEAPPAAATEEAALPTSQQFDPPLTESGKPLSACVDADFDDCGKAAARAYCESLGFTKASDIDIDTKKVQAETLGGALCTAKKCKVVDKVTCSR
jgi:hypothetical protein